MKKVLTLLLSLVWICSLYAVNVISLNGDTPPDIEGVGMTIPYRDVVTDSDGNITVTYTFNYVATQDDPQLDGNALLTIEGFGVNDIDKEGAWLKRIDKFEAPAGTTPNVSLLSHEYVEFSHTLSPARPPVIDSATSVLSAESISPITPYSGFKPESVVDYQGTVTQRDRKICVVQIHPIQYSVTTQKVRACTKISYKITFTQENSPESLSDAVFHAADNAGITYDTNVNIGNPNVQLAIYHEPGYLILTTPAYKEAADKFADWKRLMGYKPKVLSHSSWDTGGIQAAIRSHYAADEYFQYVLLLGDYNDLPGMRYGNIYTDYVYGCMDAGGDFEQDVYVGRIGVSSAEEAMTVIEKIIDYDKTPITNKSFYTKALHCGYFQDLDGDTYEDRRFIKTSEEIRDYMMVQGVTADRVYHADDNVNPKYWNNTVYSFGDQIKPELRHPYFSWNGNFSDIISKFGAGQSYVLYRGHGNVTGWGAPQFDNSNVASLPSTSELPVVFSITCLTGTYRFTSFAEELLKKSGGGAVGVIAASEVSYSGYNDVLAEGMFNAIWPEPGLEPVFPKSTPTGIENASPVYELGKILRKGMESVTAKYGTGGTALQTKLLFHVFGDPSMELRTDFKGYLPAGLKYYNEVSYQLDLTNTPWDVRVTVYNTKTGKTSHNTGKFCLISKSELPYCYIALRAHNYAPRIITPTIAGQLAAGIAEPARIVSCSSMGGNTEIELETAESDRDINVTVTNVFGNHVASTSVDTGDADNKVRFESLPAGIYVVTLSIDGTVVDSKRLVVK